MEGAWGLALPWEEKWMAWAAREQRDGEREPGRGSE